MPLSQDEVELSLTIARQLAFAVDRKRTDEALARERELLDRLFQTMPVMVSMYDPKTNSLRLNAEFERRMGWKTEELTIGSMLESMYPDPDYRTQVIQRMSAAGPNDWVEVQVRTRAGRALDSMWANISLLDDRYIGIGVDITERKQAEEQIRESEEKYRRIVETASEGIWEMDKDTRTIFVNPRMAEILGYTVDEMLGHSSFEFVFPEDYTEGERRLESAKGGMPARGSEFRYRRKDGSTVWLMASNTPKRDEQGNFLGTFAMMSDVTDRKRNEEALRVSEQRFREIFETAGVSVWLEDFTHVKTALEGLRAQGVDDFPAYFAEHPDFVRETINLVQILDVNNETLDLFKARNKKDLLGSLSNVFAPETENIFVEELLALAEGRERLRAETKVRTLDGKPISVLFTVHFAPSMEDQSHVVVTLTDITERKRAEEDLRASETLYRTIARSIPGGGIYVVDKDMRYIVADGAVTEAFGLSREMLEGHMVTEVFRDEQPSRMLERLKRNFAGETISYETEHNGRVYWTQQAPLLESIGQVIIVTLDITERKQMEEALRQSEERFSQFMQHLPGLAWIKDMQGRYVYANASAEAAFRTPLEKLYGKTDEDVFSPEVATQFKKNDDLALLDKNGVQVVETLEHDDGILHYSLVNKFPIPGPDGDIELIGGTAFDITERKQAEEALRRNEKMFSTLVDAAPFGVYFIDSNFVCVPSERFGSGFSGITAHRTRFCRDYPHHLAGTVCQEVSSVFAIRSSQASLLFHQP